MFMVTGKFTIDPARRDEFLAFIRGIIAEERQTAGIISFDVYEDVVEANTFLMVEQWEDETALDDYTETEAYAEHDDTLNGFVVGEAVWDEYEF